MSASKLPDKIKHKGRIYVKAAGKIVAENNRAAFLDYEEMNKEIERSLGKGWTIFDMIEKPKMKMTGRHIEITYPTTLVRNGDDSGKKIKADLNIGVYEVEGDGLGITYQVVTKT